MRPDLTINGIWTLGMARGLEARGLDLPALCRRAGLTPSELRDPDARLPIDALVSLWREAERVSGDPLVGLHAGAGGHVSLSNVVALLVACSRNLREGIARVLRYENPLLAHGAMATLENLGDDVALRFRDFRGELETPRHVTDFVVAALVRFCEFATARDLELRSAQLTHPYPGHQAEYERVLGCPVHFGAQVNELVIPRRVMLSPLPNHSPGTIRYLEAVAEQERQRIGEPRLAARLRGMLRLRLPREPTDEDSLAAVLHMSARSLRRHLEDEDTSFSAVLDEARRELALERLAEGDPVSRVAATCGFANSGNFVRAFRRWTGRTPSEARRRGAARGRARSRPSPVSSRRRP